MSLLFVFFALLGLSCAQRVVVRLPDGPIVGQTEPSLDGRHVTVFRGVPYAEPPVGDLRFRRPRPRAPWSAPMEALAFSSACVQNGAMFEVELYLANKSFSEDCLYLNVWSPETDVDDDDALRAVVVWIHGGGLLVGSASEVYYRGDALATMGDVVVVSFNYRLNALGFLYSGDADDAPGNVGLWDQALALEWVKDNIRYLGGDARRVTIMGESAGGWSVSLHVLSPVSRHLFARAIAQSGAHLYFFGEDTPEHHIKRWLKGAALVGCAGDAFSPEVMRCLRAVDARALAAVTDERTLMMGSVGVFNLVVIDGHFLPQKAVEMLRNGDFKRDVQLMVSTVEDEGSFLLTWLTDPQKFHPHNPHNFSLAEAHRELTHISTHLCCDRPIDGAAVAKLYLTGVRDDDSRAMLRRMGVAVGDYYLTCPTLAFAKAVAKHGVRVFEYYFSAKFSENFFCSQWMGVCHTNDVFPTFGLPFLEPHDYCDREREISRQMIGFLSHFAKTGFDLTEDSNICFNSCFHRNALKQKGVEWPQFWRSGDDVVAPFLHIGNARSDVRVGLKLQECERLWNQYFL